MERDMRAREGGEMTVTTPGSVSIAMLSLSVALSQMQGYPIIALSTPTQPERAQQHDCIAHEKAGRPFMISTNY